MKKGRLQSLDILRGITIAAMILVNDPGSWSHVFAPLLHAPWHGCTPTDLVFPFFLFMVGLAVSLGTPKLGAARRIAIKQNAKRSLYLILIGLFLNGFPYFDFESIRIFGVLQRIGLVFLAVAIIHQLYSFQTQLWIGVGLLLGYWAAMALIPVPGFGNANLNIGTNLSAWVDYALLPGHLWAGSRTWDPEGLLSTFPAIATGLLGMVTGEMLFKAEEKAKGLLQVFVLANILIVIGLIWDLIFPINKSLWTSSYVLYTGGIAMNFFAVLYWLLDHLNYRSIWLKPFEVFGSNAITAYAISSLLAISIDILTIGNGSIHHQMFELLVSILGDEKLASFVFAVNFLIVCYVPIWVLYRKKIFIKV